MILKKELFIELYRGTKEMDVLISSFVASIINKLNYEELADFRKFCKFK